MYVTPAEAVANGCKMSNLSDHTHAYATHVYSWILECYDAYNNRVILPEKSLNMVVVPKFYDFIFVTKQGNNGYVEMSLR